MEYPKKLLYIFLILFLMGEVLGLKCYESNLNASCTQTKDKTELLKCYKNLPATPKEAKERWMLCSTLSLEFDNKTRVVLEFNESDNDCKTGIVNHYQRILEEALGMTGTYWRCEFCHEDNCNMPSSERKKMEEKEQKKKNKKKKENKRKKENKKKEIEKSTAKRCTSCIYAPVCCLILFLVYFLYNI